jgi:hypothetical protein
MSATSTTELDRRLDRAVELVAAGCPPYTGATPTFRKCGHSRTEENVYRYYRADRGRFVEQCRTCQTARGQRRYEKTREPATCNSCARPLSEGKRAPGGYHLGTCEPTTCTCDDGGRPNGLGECGVCHRLVLSHSWHAGAPTG